jgi:hypothetical protein
MADATFRRRRRVDSRRSPPLLVALSGGDAVVARDMLTMRANTLKVQINDALDRPGPADARRSRRHRGGLRVVADSRGPPRRFRLA